MRRRRHPADRSEFRRDRGRWFGCRALYPRSFVYVRRDRQRGRQWRHAMSTWRCLPSPRIIVITFLLRQLYRPGHPSSPMSNSVTAGLADQLGVPAQHGEADVAKQRTVRRSRARESDVQNLLSRRGSRKPLTASTTAGRSRPAVGSPTSAPSWTRVQLRGAGGDGLLVDRFADAGRCGCPGFEVLHDLAVEAVHGVQDGVDERASSAFGAERLDGVRDADAALDRKSVV